MTLFLVWMLTYPLVATGRKAMRHRWIVGGFDGDQDRNQTLWDLSVYLVVGLTLFAHGNRLLFSDFLVLAVGILGLAVLGYGIKTIYPWAAQKIRALT